MKTLDYTGKFKKDLKRIRRRGWQEEKLKHIVHMLRLGKSLPTSCRPHKLGGEWRGFWECHIEADWLLIYDVTNDAILLAGTGSHADLFE